MQQYCSFPATSAQVKQIWLKSSFIDVFDEKLVEKLCNINPKNVKNSAVFSLAVQDLYIKIYHCEGSKY